MSAAQFDAIKSYAELTDEDARFLRRARGDICHRFGAIVEDFYRQVLATDGLRQLLRGEAQMASLRRTLGAWLDDVFNGPYDAAYARRRTDIGLAHVGIGLSQAYVFAAMSRIRQRLEQAILEDLGGDPARMRSTLAALGKVLDLDLALIAGSYHEAETCRALVEQASLARLGEMAAVVAHEIKNPLAGIGGAIEVISSQLPAGGPGRLMAEEVLERLDALNNTVNDMLLFARPRLPRPAPVPMVSLFEDIVALLRQDPELGRIAVDTRIPDIVVPCDAELLKPALLNIILNGAQAMKGEGRLRIAVERRAPHCRIAIADTGPGIPAELRDRVFEPFFSTRHRGTGLGLPIARRVVEAHGGRLEIACPAAGGTTVYIDLPLQPPAMLPGGRE